MDNPIQPKMNPAPAHGNRPMMPPQGPRPPMGPSAAGGMAMTPKEIMGILRRHIWMIILFTVLGTILGGVSWFLCDHFIPKYKSVATVDVEPPIEIDPMQITGIQPQKDIYYQFRFTKASLIKQDYMLRELLNQSDKVRDTHWFKKFAKLNADGNIVGDRDKAVNEALKDLEDNLSASAPRDQNYILVSMRCGKPKEAKLIVDEMVRIFLSQQRTLAQSGLTDELTKLKMQKDNIQAALDRIEGSLASIRSGTRFARLNLGEAQGFRDYMDQRLADLEDRYNELGSEKGRLESIIVTLEARATAEDFDKRVQQQVELDSIAQQLSSSIALLEPQLNRQLARFGEDHRLVRQTQAALAQLREGLAQRQRKIGDIMRQSNLMGAQEEMAALVQQLDTVEQQLQSARDEYKEIDRIRNDYSRLEEKRQENLALLEEMNTLIEKKNAQHENPKISKLSSPYPATEPREKSFPLKIVFLPGGFILGLFAGLGLAFFVELMNDLLRSPSDVMRHLKAPLMGMVCHVDDDDDIEGVDLYHVVRQAPYSIMSECYRQLRTNLKLFGTASSGNKTLFVTSGQAGDGKTTVAVNLASTLLAENRNVLLIDVNFRRPSTARLFPDSQADGAPAEFADSGLSNYLMGQCDTEDQIIRESGIEGLYIIDSGPLPPNPAELLSGDRMRSLLEHCKTNFDYVIIDGPATLVSDSKTVASVADGTIVVFNATSTRRGAAMRILRELRDIHANIAGTVLMAVKSRKGGYFREIYRSYQEYQRVHLERPI